MITRTRAAEGTGEHPVYIYYGLSSDTKPLKKDGAVHNGAAFLEMDTCNLYFFCEDGEDPEADGEWVKAK